MTSYVVVTFTYTCTQTLYVVLHSDVEELEFVIQQALDPNLVFLAMLLQLSQVPNKIVNRN